MEETIRIEGMHCNGCAGRMKRVLEMERGVREADVSQEAGEVRVKYNEHAATTERLRELIEQAGYSVGNGG